MSEPTFEQLAVKRRQLAQEYNRDTKRLGEIKMLKATKMIELMAEHGTKAKAEVYFEASELGQEELKLTYHTRGLLELMRALKTEIDIKNAEAFNQY